MRFPVNINRDTLIEKFEAASVQPRSQSPGFCELTALLYYWFNKLGMWVPAEIPLGDVPMYIATALEAIHHIEVSDLIPAALRDRYLMAVRTVEENQWTPEPIESDLFPLPLSLQSNGERRAHLLRLVCDELPLLMVPQPEFGTALGSLFREYFRGKDTCVAQIVDRFSVQIGRDPSFQELMAASPGEIKLGPVQLKWKTAESQLALEFCQTSGSQHQPTIHAVLVMKEVRREDVRFRVAGTHNVTVQMVAEMFDHIHAHWPEYLSYRADHARHIKVD